MGMKHPIDPQWITFAKNELERLNELYIIDLQTEIQAKRAAFLEVFIDRAYRKISMPINDYNDVFVNWVSELNRTATRENQFKISVMVFTVNNLKKYYKLA